MPKPIETHRAWLDPAQVEELLRELLDDGTHAEPNPARWNTAFCASGGKTPMCL